MEENRSSKCGAAGGKASRIMITMPKGTRLSSLGLGYSIKILGRQRGPLPSVTTAREGRKSVAEGRRSDRKSSDSKKKTLNRREQKKKETEGLAGKMLEAGGSS